MITIAETTCGYEREALRAPFAFKGHALTELWQPAVSLTDVAGRQGVGVGTQSVLWSDSAAFVRSGEETGNELMFRITAEALRRCARQSFSSPPELLEAIFPELLTFARRITGLGRLRPTFVLNALVAVDHAAWQLFAAVRGLTAINGLLGPYRALQSHHRRLGNTPLLTYRDPAADAARFAQEGAFVLKIKLGHNPDDRGDPQHMLAWDCARMSEIHAALRGVETPHTTTGRVAYYLDANARYGSLDHVRRLLDHCEKIGALADIILLEEPFEEARAFDVHDLPVRVAADESAHSVADVHARIDAGYRAIALKPAAKSFSISLAMAAAAHARGAASFCADLTANPVLVDWAKTLAARLPTLPGLNLGMFETNGRQLYRDWDRLTTYHPMPAAPWIHSHEGIFELPERFFSEWGAIFTPASHYAEIACAAGTSPTSPPKKEAAPR